MSLADVIKAAAMLRSGRLVAFPTETVYGLGADATNAEAVRRIFAAKGRPTTNPLIVHVPDAAAAKRYARVWPETAQVLAERFWPGPLTFVLPRSDAIVPEVTAGRETVGLRAPDHPLMLQLLRVCDLPIAGPSANKSNHVSPTTADHVRQEFASGEIDMVLDGGRCIVGIESTVLDLSGDRPTILRPGGISRQRIEEIIGVVDAFSGSADLSQSAASPGQQEVHYAPRVPAYRITRSMQGPTPGAPVMILGRRYRERRIGGSAFVELPDNPEEYARLFYAVLRDLDARHPPAIFIEMPPDVPEWAAVRDRIMRATRPLP